MHLYSGPLMAMVLVTACAAPDYSPVTLRTSTAGAPPAALMSCAADQPCELTGTLTLQRRSGTNSWAALSQGPACAPLLLPESVYRSWRSWNGKRVHVRGTALGRGPNSAPEILQVKYRDRWLAPIICGESARVLYVDEIARAP